MATGGKDQSKDANKKYWEKIKNISDFYSNSLSRQIINLCIEKGASIIILPKYNETYTKYVMSSIGIFSPLHLSGRVRDQLGFKAWQAGIVILKTNPFNSSSVCAICGAKVHKVNDSFFCDNGHMGSRYINTAHNLGLRCTKGFVKQAHPVSMTESCK